MVPTIPPRTYSSSTHGSVYTGPKGSPRIIFRIGTSVQERSLVRTGKETPPLVAASPGISEKFLPVELFGGQDGRMADFPSANCSQDDTILPRDRGQIDKKRDEGRPVLCVRRSFNPTNVQWMW